MDFKKWKLTRRQLIKAGLISGAGMMLPLRFTPRKAFAVAQNSHFGLLNDPSNVKKFFMAVPDALAPTFKYAPMGMRAGNPFFRVGVSAISNHQWGETMSGSPLTTNAWGYGGTWPGKTFEVQSGMPISVQWQNNLTGVTQHLLPVDTTLHWCYSLPGYEDYTIANAGVPIVTHLHGGHTRYLFDGNPEQFFTPRWSVTGPRFRGRTAIYNNDQHAGNLWYHDHALGITRLNVYAGLAGFYFIRDDIDTGTVDNPLDLPAWPYEKAYAIQDRMFQVGGQLFYPSVQYDPFWNDFIISEGVTLCGLGVDPPCINANDPTALAEFFGDHMVVNGIAWPYETVEPRQYRLHLLNGTDSRFMVIQFRKAASSNSTDLTGAGSPLPFHVIGSDQGLASSATPVTQLVFEPGSRYDIVFDFAQDGISMGDRIIMANIGGDEPFGGTPGAFEFGETDRIMAFDVTETLDTDVPDDFDPDSIGQYGGNTDTVTRTRKVALFEGNDEYGRLQPLLGTAEPATDFRGRTINWPNTQPYIDAGLTGPMEGSIAWHSPTTENPALNATEIWEIYNATGDAHPIHLHLVNFEILDRQEFNASVISQNVVQHNGAIGQGYRLENIVKVGSTVSPPMDGYVENAPKDMVSALPTQSTNTGQVTRIKVTFDKSQRYVWHCHILSHEDHEMMRVLHVGGGA